MKTVLIYISPNGTTRIITKELTKLITADGHEVVEIDVGKAINCKLTDEAVELIKAADIIGIGSPVYHMSLLEPMQVYIDELFSKCASHMMNKKAFMYITYAGITTGRAFLDGLKILKKYKVKSVGGVKVYGPHFWNTKGYPYDDTVRFLSEFYCKLSSSGFAEIEEARAQELFSYQKALVNILYPFAHVIGTKRALQICFDTQKCIMCKRCAIECPVGAITLTHAPIKDDKKCIYCYHCTTICSKAAVICQTEKIQNMVRFNIKILGEEKPKNGYYLP